MSTSVFTPILCILSFPFQHGVNVQGMSEHIGVHSCPAHSLSLHLNISQMPKTGVSTTQGVSEHISVHSHSVHSLSFPLDISWTPRTRASTYVLTPVLCVLSFPFRHGVNAQGVSKHIGVCSHPAHSLSLHLNISQMPKTGVSTSVPAPALYVCFLLSLLTWCEHPGHE